MQTYYHNTAADNANNCTLLYLDHYGDWAETKSELQDEIVAKVVIESGWIPGVTIDDYCNTVAGIACRALNINPEYHQQ